MILIIFSESIRMMGSDWNRGMYLLNSFNRLSLFLWNERGEARLANIKLQDANFERTSASLTIRNKIDAVNAEIGFLAQQNCLVCTVVSDYENLVRAEERKFFLGESSLFLINSREQKLIDARLKENELRVKELKATASLFNVLGIPDRAGVSN